ncbi:patatin-like phospholipase family protein [Fulvivirga sp. M361]|uniref:patatin-like phospholipase family protein n=1 Tax=Fulvivirga sp. M361 TaxID=2594266 RepID=UPI00162439EE|nr:patatin-like phospholipase family protein [Fulvivirga sp. M361]
MFSATLLSWQVTAQKVGLVLSGGGAKGLAHLGVIKALEENDVPIDYLVGTSMGGIIAGCYAAGYSAAEIEEIILSADFQRWVNGEFEKGFNFYYSKEDPTSAILSLQLSLDSTFNASVTSTIAEDLALNFALAEKFAIQSAKAGYNFDSLLVPVRIIASEIFTQHEEIIKKGSLGGALRATLSVPFFYKPIRFNGKYLFDGGIYNNFPVDIALKEFNPDVVIGSNVSSKIFNEYPYESDDKLINKSLLFMILDKSDPDLIPESGIYVEPDLAGYTTFDFNKARSLIDSGYTATMAKMKEIFTKVSSRRTLPELEKRRQDFKNGQQPLSFSSIDFHGFNSRQRRYIRHLFKKKPDQHLTFEQIKKGYFKLMSEDYFRTIYPEMLFNHEENAYGLHLYGRPENNFNVSIGGAIATRNISQIFLGLEHYHFDNYLLKNSLNFQAGGFYKSIQLRTRLSLPALGQFFIESELTFNSWDFLSADDILSTSQSPTVLDRIDRKYGLNIGFPLGAKFRAVLNGAWINNQDKFSNFNNFTSTDTLDRLKLDGLRFGLIVDRNNLNYKQYPNEGKSFKMAIDFFNISEEYRPGSTSESPEQSNDHQWFRLRADLEQYIRKGKYSTGYYLGGVFSNQPFFSNRMATLTNASALQPLQDSQTLFLQNFRGHNFLSAGIRNVFSIRSKLDFRAEVYAFKGFESLEDPENFEVFGDFDKVFLSGTAGLVFRSPAGPVSLSINYYDDNETQLGVLIHAGFLLFNKRSLE